MKTKLYYFFVLLSSLGFAQSITVNTNQYTVPQLVNEVLLNSPCLSVNNVSWRTGSQFGSSNGIGYFENVNPNFPMQRGVILSTGNVMNAQGPNTSMLSDGNASWPGDTELETILAQSGIAMTSTNATVLEFDFVALSPYFDFDFLFASEEYGNFQCQFSDAFAFLLTNLNTGVTTNLAVVPNTNTPISVVTIRDFLYNSACTSENAQYFGSFNGGTQAAHSATNFNGQTVVMNASATLTPNIPYRIKLVIADRVDPQSDSAIFLSANTFNIGQNVLGNDLTMATNNALCNGETYVINSGLNPSEFNFVWSRNGVILSGQNGPSLTVTQGGTYELTYSNIAYPCQSVSDSIVIEYNQNFTTPAPINILRCDTGASSYQFNLGINTPRVTQGITAATTVTYHATLAQANSGTNALPLFYTSTGNQTIYVRIQRNNTACFAVHPFELLVTPPPTANDPGDLIACALITNQTRARFVLSNHTPLILNGQSNTQNQVTYHFTLAQAQNGTNTLNANALTTTERTIYARVQNVTDSNCFSIVSFNLVIASLPVVDVLEDVIVCDNYALPPLNNGEYFTGPNGTGTQKFPGDIITESQRMYIYRMGEGTPSCPNQSSFMITIVDPNDISLSNGEYCTEYVLPSLPFGSFYSEPNGSGTVLDSGTVLTNSQTIYYHFQSTEPPFCSIDMGIEVTIVPSPTVSSLENVFDCTSYTLPALSNGTYYDAPNGGGNTFAAGDVITETKTIYIFAENNGCISETSFTIYIGLNVPNSITECISYTLPPLPIGGYFTAPNGGGQAIPAGTPLTTSQTVYVYAPSQSQPNCTDQLSFPVTITLPILEVPAVTSACEIYVLPELTTGNYYTAPNGTGTLLQPGSEITTSQTLYIYINNGNGCQNTVSFDVTVLSKPNIDSRSDIDGCNSYVLTPLAIGNYFTGPNGTGTPLFGGDVITTSQRIYIYAVENGCAAETSFQVNVFDIQADSLPNVAVCDSYVLPQLTPGNQYYTQPNGPNGFGTLLSPGTVITSNQTLYIYKENQIRPAFSCIDQTSFTVTVYTTPLVAQPAPVFVCNAYILPALSVGNYFTAPNGGGTLLTAGTEITTTQTLYVYAETGTTPNCFDQKSFVVTVYNVDELPNVVTCASYQLPALTVGRYYNGPNGSGGQIAAGTVLTTTRTVYIFGNSGFNPNCTDESSFTVTIVPTPVANQVPVSLRTTCDEDGTNDGITAFNLNILTASVLGTQSGSEFVVTYHETLEEATTNSNPVNQTTQSTIHVRVTNILAPDCFATRTLQIIVNRLPEPSPVGGYVCVESATGFVLSSFTISSGLSAATHSFEWYLDAQLMPNTTASITVSAPGNYAVVATNLATGCSSEPAEVEVLASEPATISFTTSVAFSNTNTVTIIAQGVGGNYEYSLDGSPFQDSPEFTNVASGIHTVVVNDKNGCGTATGTVLVINYPKFFTPNGDGYNDTWNIIDLQNQPNALISIYDRYGKFLAQIRPNGQGWNGTLNGNPLPSTDYWFTVTYEENEVKKEFKSHFSLKR